MAMIQYTATFLQRIITAALSVNRAITTMRWYLLIEQPVIVVEAVAIVPPAQVLTGVTVADTVVAKRRSEAVAEFETLRRPVSRQLV